MKKNSKNQDLTLPFKAWEQLKSGPKNLNDVVGNLCIKKDINIEMVIFLREDIALILEKLLAREFITRTQEGYYRIIQKTFNSEEGAQGTV